MLHTFDKKISIFPSIAAEHIMLSMAEWASAWDVEAKKFVISPMDIAIFATSLLGTLYYWLSQQQDIKHIIYLWSDEDLPINTIKIPKSSWVKQVLWRTLKYGVENYKIVLDSLGHTFVSDDSFFATNEFWYSHAHYLSFLDKDIAVSPYVFSSKSDLNLLKTPLFDSLASYENTIVIVSDNMRFRIQDSKQWSHILTLKNQSYTWFDMFCDYCEKHKLLPTIMRIEGVDNDDALWKKDTIYQWVLLA